MQASVVGRTQRAAIVLAGGEGVRLRSFTEGVAGRPIPKQYCPIMGTETMLNWTLRRVSLGVNRRSILTIVTAHHAEFYGAQLADADEDSVVVQPSNRGTAAAILHGLLRLVKQKPDGAVAIFPSDHYVSDDCRFMAQVDQAFEFVQALPQRVVLLGIEACAPEVEYGWIEPGVPLVRGWSSSFRNFLRVRRFHEKPPKAIAEELFRAGGLWNSFVIVGNIKRLIALIARALPDLHGAFRAIERTLGTSFERKAIECLYRDLPAANFSYEVLQNAFSSMAVLPVTGLEWSDLGTPDRLLAVLKRIERESVPRPSVELVAPLNQAIGEESLFRNSSRLASARAGSIRLVPAQR